MTEDARFEDGGDKPLNLGALSQEDLQVISSLVQDSILPITEMSWRPDENRFALLINRFRWEDVDQAHQLGRPVERVQSLLVIDHVLRVASQGIDKRDGDTILSVMSIGFEATEDGAGYVLITLAGDGAVRLMVEALEVGLRDVTRPYRAPSGQTPSHQS